MRIEAELNLDQLKLTLAEVRLSEAQWEEI